MLHHVFSTATDNYPIAILVKAAAFNIREIENTYIKRFENRGFKREDIIIFALNYNDKGKASPTFIKEELKELMPALGSVGVKYVYCADASYFKVITKSIKAELHLGYSLKCQIKDYEYLDVTLGVNHKSLIRNPANESKLILSINTLADIINGQYQGLGNGIIQGASYPSGVAEIKTALAFLHQYDNLSADIETASLDFEKAGIATIAFCWNQHEGLAFACDFVANPNGKDEHGFFGRLVPSPEIRGLLKAFFESYKGTLTWHNSNYDLSILIYELWMDNLLDTAGLLKGLEVMTQKYHDTKIIAYLATNTTAGNELGLKQLAHEFAGNWANEEIKDVRRIPLPALLEYNLIDGLSTNYVFDKYYPKMVADDQEGVYFNVMLPSQVTIIQIELSGMALSPERVQIAKKELKTIVNKQKLILENLLIIRTLIQALRKEAMDKANQKLKTKQHPISKFANKSDRAYVGFNPNSGLQKIKLIYEEMGLPILNRTKGGQPSTKGKHLEVLLNHTTNPDYIAVLKALITHTTANKILTSFIPAFEAAIDKGDGVVWLHGSFNLGGTKSGRLSSSNPNLQNIPAGSIYGKLIKSCFVAPKGWLFCGADFNSLEDYISALTTRDPNKMKVYTDGYDGHCLRAFNYFPDELPGIVDTVASINSIKEKFPKVRQSSKGPTFLLTYQGTSHGLQHNLGWDEETALRIEANYHDLYAVSDKYVADKLKEASHTGYVEVAFGLRLRTPLLSSTVRGNGATPFEAESEARTAGNALGQSYGLLNNRAANEFMRRVWVSPWRLLIKPVALIHDAIYLLIKDDIKVVAWVNDNLIECMEWQNLPELKHDTVKLGAELSIFWPDWSSEIVVPNGSTQAEIRTQCVDFQRAYKAKQVLLAAANA